MFSRFGPHSRMANSHMVTPGATWNPAKLSNMFGSNWAWFRPSLSPLNIWQDSTGTTAVTAAAQSVGFTSDYRGIELGPELVTNGGFDSDTAWTKNAGWTISGGAANFSGSASGNNIYQSSSAFAGRMYLITVQISSFSGTIGHSVRLGSVYSSTAHPSIASAGTYTYKLVAAENNAIIGVVGYTGTGATTVSVESISVREITNAYALQATTANKPTYYTDARSVPVLRHDTTDVLTAAFATTMGSSASVYYATASGVIQSHGVNVGTSYPLPGKPGSGTADVYEYIITPSRPDSATEAKIVAWLTKTAGL